jgi:hypothetical protein
MSKFNLISKAFKQIDLKKSIELEDQNKPLFIESIPGVRIKRLDNKGYSYSDRHRGNWFKPEYDLTELQIAQDTDAYIFKAIQKKVHKIILAGWEFVGKDKEVVNYIKKRLREIEIVSGMPFDMMIINTAHDLARYSNCMWVKVRDSEASSGVIRPHLNKELDPVAGYFLLPFETLWFKVKPNGEIKKVMQIMHNTGKSKEFNPEDVVHFYTNKKPGFTMGTPEILPVLEDVALLRRLEENVESMVDANLNPLFHYTVGTDQHPERYGPDGTKETDIVRQTIEYMPSGGIFVSDHRHKIEVLGAEGKALNAIEYLDYFKKRVFAGLGVTPMDMGEGDSANSSTASTLSKSAIQDVEALQANIKMFIDTYVISELLIEGGYSDAVMDPEKRVEIKFGTVDKEEKSKLENQTIQLWLNKLITEDEARKRLGEKSIEESDRDKNYYKLYEEPAALLKIMGSPVSAAAQALAAAPTSNITQSQLSKEESNNKSNNANNKNTNQLSKSNVIKPGPSNQSANQARPANQQGVRLAPKLTKDNSSNEKNSVKGLDENNQKNLNYLIFDTIDKILNTEDIDSVLDDFIQSIKETDKE